MLLAPSYWQARQPEVMKQSPPRAVTPNPSPSMESPKTICSSGKGGPLRGSGHSSNTSTPKCPDSTSAKKPSSYKEPTSNGQEKSPKACGFCKHGRSPSPSTESVGCKWKDVHTEDTRTLNSTLLISSSAFDTLCSPTGSHSNGTELLPPSITSTPLGLGGLRQWQTTSDKSRHSMASIYTSPNFNLPGYPAAGPGNLTPTVPSLAGSHHVSSTWPTSMFTSGPSSPHLAIDQANSIFKLVAECQALGIKLAKQFQVLLGLEAMHRNSIQGTAHETLTLGHSAWEAAYLAILWDGVSEAECEATTCHLCSEADAAWKEMHEVMYNHQFHYGQQLSTFLTDTKTALNNMRGKVWAAVHTLAENEGITFNACLGLVLQVLNLLPQIPVGHPTLCPKSWAGSPTNQARAWIVPHLQLLLTTLWDQVGHGAPDIDPAALPKVSLLPGAGNQAQWAWWQVITVFGPTPPKVVRCQAANLNSTMMRKTSLVKMKMLKQTRVGSDFK